MNTQSKRFSNKPNKTGSELLLKLEHYNIKRECLSTDNKGNIYGICLKFQASSNRIPNEVYFTHLKHLSITGNFQSNINFIVKHKNLEKLTFNSCGLTKIPELGKNYPIKRIKAFRQ